MSLLSKVLKSIAFTIGSEYGRVFFTIIDFLILIWVLEQAEYGSYALAISFAYAASVVPNLGIGKLIISEITQSLSSGKVGKAADLFFQYCRWGVLSAAGVLILFVLLSGIFEELYGIGLVLAFFAGLIIVCNTGKTIYHIAFISQMRFKDMALFNVVQYSTRTIILIALVYFAGFGAAGAVASQVISYVLSAVVLAKPFGEFINTLKSAGTSGKSLLKEYFFSRGKYLFVSGQLIALKENSMLWLTGIYFGPDGAALLSAAKKFLEPINIALGSLEAVALPLFSSKITEGKEVIANIYFAFSKFGLYLSILLSAGFAVFLHLFAGFFLPLDYMSALPLFYILLISEILLGFGASQRALLHMLRMQKTFFVDAAISLAMMLATFFILQGHFGIESAAMAVSASSVIVLIRHHRIMRLPYMQRSIIETLFPTKKDLPLVRRVWGIFKVKIGMPD